LASNGNCEYIYRYNNELLDVVCLLKNCRYQFVLPFAPVGEGSETKSKGLGSFLEIKNRLLIILHETHIYIHDMTMQYNRFMALDCK
jgi:hypothetical protein